MTDDTYGTLKIVNTQTNHCTHNNDITKQENTIEHEV